MFEKVVLVDNEDNVVGKEEKVTAHKKGFLHRAFSIFVFNSKGEILLQKRARNKYHSGGLWSNACCGHPRPREKLETAAKRRLKEEMGFNCDLKEIFDFKYKIGFANGLTENEVDHVFIGIYDDNPMPNSEEVEDWKFMNIKELEDDMMEKPDKYTYWFSLSVKKVLASTRTTG